MVSHQPLNGVAEGIDHHRVELNVVTLVVCLAGAVANRLDLRQGQPCLPDGFDVAHFQRLAARAGKLGRRVAKRLEAHPPLTFRRNNVVLEVCHLCEGVVLRQERHHSLGDIVAPVIGHVDRSGRFRYVVIDIGEELLACLQWEIMGQHQRDADWLSVSPAELS